MKSLQATEEKEEHTCDVDTEGHDNDESATTEVILKIMPAPDDAEKGKGKTEGA